MIFKHTLKDSLSNLISRSRAKKWAGKFNGETRSVQPPAGYQPVFVDDFTSPIDRQKWLLNPVWGDFHSDNLTMYFDTTGEMARVGENGLELWLKREPKSWKRDSLPLWRQRQTMPETITIPVGVGMIHSRRAWKWGWFEAWIQLPKGSPYWPAFWLSGAETWPPEIDIFEGYSHLGEKYQAKTLLGGEKPNRKIQPNLHWGDSATNTVQWGGKDVEVADCTERLVQYACLWEPDRIEIYYDGIKVFQCTDRRVLDWFNRETSAQNLIINHGYHKDWAHVEPEESRMLVRSVRVLQKDY
jgi:hypothetical protein